MKKKLTCILLAVSVVLAFAGCGGGGNYEYTEEDLSDYASFNKAAFEAGLSSLEIEDGDFTADESVRQQKLRDKLLTALAGKLDDADAKIKLYSGAVGERDIVYYCYYCTAELDGETKYFFTSDVLPKNATKLQLGLSSNTEMAAAMERFFLGKTLDGAVCAAKTDGIAEAGKQAFISYTVEYEKDGNSVTERHLYEPIILGEGSFIAEALVGKTVGKAQEKITELCGESEKVYTKAVVNLVLEGEGYTHTDVTYTTSKNVKDSTDKMYNLDGVELTYHVYPLYRVEIPEINSKNLLGILAEEIEDAELTCLLDHAPQLDGLIDAAMARRSALTELNKAQAAHESATERYAEAKRAYENGEDGVWEETLERLKSSAERTESVLSEKKVIYSACDKKAAEKLDAFLELDGAEKVAEEFSKVLYGRMLEQYSAEIRENLAEAIYELIIGNVTVRSVPDEAAEAVYGNIIAEYKYNYENGKYTSAGETNKEHYGSFEEYLVKVTAAADYEAAEELLRKDAQRGAERYTAIYCVAEAYGVEITSGDVQAVIAKPSLYWDAYLKYERFAGGVYAQDIKILGAPKTEESPSDPSGPAPKAIFASAGGVLSERVRADIQLFRILDEFLTSEREKNPCGGYDILYNNPLLKFVTVQNEG